MLKILSVWNRMLKVLSTLIYHLSTKICTDGYFHRNSPDSRVLVIGQFWNGRTKLSVLESFTRPFRVSAGWFVEYEQDVPTVLLHFCFVVWLFCFHALLHYIVAHSLLVSCLQMENFKFHWQYCCSNFQICNCNY